jgi:hypothetical protein
MLSSLRHRIVESVFTDSLGYVEQPIPLSWFALCDELRLLSKDHPFIHRKRPNSNGNGEEDLNLAPPCLWELAVKYGVFQAISGSDSPEEANDLLLRVMLNKFHELGVLIYFETSSLADYIILDSQWLINKIVYLIRDVKRHRFHRDRIALSRFPLKWERLFAHGVLHESLLKAFWGNDLQLIHFLIHVLQELGLLCCLSGDTDTSVNENLYFIPASVLYVERDVTTIRDSSHRNDCSVRIVFEQQKMPNGFKDRLLVSLVKCCSHLYTTEDALNHLLCEDNGQFVSCLVLNRENKSGDKVDQIGSTFSVAMYPDPIGECNGSISFVCDSCESDALVLILKDHCSKIVSSFLHHSVSFEIINCRVHNDDQQTSATLFAAAVDNDNASDDGNGCVVLGLDDQQPIEQGTSRTEFIYDERRRMEGLQALQSWLESVDEFSSFSPSLSVVLITELATSLLDAGYVGLDAVECLRCRFEDDGEQTFRSFLFQIGIESSAHHSLLINLLKQLPPYATCLTPYCICFCESDHHDLFEEVREVKQGLTMKGFVSRPFTMNSIHNELSRDNSCYQLVLISAANTPFTTLTGEMFSFRRSLETEVLRSSNMTFEMFVNLLATPLLLQLQQQKQYQHATSSSSSSLLSSASSASSEIGVILSASYSSNIARRLCEEGVPWVIGWKTKVNSLAATLFTAELIRHLHQTSSIEICIPQSEDCFRIKAIPFDRS